MNKVANLLKTAYDEMAMAQNVQQQQAAYPAGVNGEQQQTADPDSMFKDQIKQVMTQFIQSKFPWVRPDSVLNIIDTDIEKNYVVASLDVTINDVVLKVPFVYSEGEISEPWAIFVEGENRFFEFSQAWYERLIKSAETKDGTVTDWNNTGYYTAYNENNRIMEPNSVGGMVNTRYAALNKLSLKELKPIIKLALSNGYVYEQFGRMAIKVAAQKLISTTKSTGVANGYRVKRGSLYVFDWPGMKKVTAGLSLSERVAAYNQITKRGYAIIDKRLDHDKLNVYKADEESSYIMPLETILDSAHLLIGSFDRRDGAPVFYIPGDLYLRDRVTTGRDPLRHEWKMKLEVGYEGKNRHIFRNENAEDNFISFIDEKREKSVPTFIKTVIDLKSDQFDAERDKMNEKDYSSQNYYIIPVAKKSDKFAIRAQLSRYIQYDELRNVFRYYNLSRTDESGYVYDDRDVKYAVVFEPNVAGSLFTDLPEFIFKSATLKDYLQKGFSVKRNYNGTYDMEVDGDEVQTTTQKESKLNDGLDRYYKNIKLFQLSKQAAIFVLGNYLKTPVDAIEGILENTGTSKYAAALTPDLTAKLQQLVQIIDGLKGDIAGPEAQQQALDGSGAGTGQITVNIENLSMGGETDPAAAGMSVPQEGAPAESVAPTADPAAAGAPVDPAAQGAPGSTGTPDINTLIAEAQKIGIPQDLIQQIINLAPTMGVTPEEMLIQAGSMVEQGINQGMPAEEVINQLRASISQVNTQTGGTVPANVNTAAAVPMEQVAPDSNIPVATDYAMQEAGAGMTAGTPGMASAPITQTMSDPMMQQQMTALSGPQDSEEVMSKSVLADIIENATLKSSFTEYIPTLTENMNTISEMILKLELNKATMVEETGNTNFEEISDKLRNVLKQIGDLILRIVSVS